MKTDDVPQQNGMIGEGYGREVCYALDAQGSYTLSLSSGWEAKNIVNAQAWERIAAEAASAHADVLAGKRSPIAWHTACHQMDLALLADYVHLPRWRVRRHLKPAIFARLSPRLLRRYADVFSITVDELQQVPPQFHPRHLTRP